MSPSLFSARGAIKQTRKIKDGRKTNDNDALCRCSWRGQVSVMLAECTFPKAERSEKAVINERSGSNIAATSHLFSVYLLLLAWNMINVSMSS